MNELEIKILKSLLENPKTFTQLLDSVIMSRPTLAEKLKNLQKQKIIKKLLRKSPYEINLQYFREKSDTVLSLLISKHDWFFNSKDPSIDKGVIESLGLDYEFVSQENTKDTLSIQKSKIEDFREKLRLSESFVKIFLENDSNILYSIFHDILTTDVETFSSKRSCFNESRICDIIFKNCVTNDIISGRRNQQAINYVQKINEKEKYIWKFLNPF